MRKTCYQRKTISLKQPFPLANIFMAICETSEIIGKCALEPSVIGILRLELVEAKFDVRNALGLRITPSRSPSVSSQKKIATSRNCFLSDITISSCMMLAELEDASPMTRRLGLQKAWTVLE